MAAKRVKCWGCGKFGTGEFCDQDCYEKWQRKEGLIEGETTTHHDNLMDAAEFTARNAWNASNDEQVQLYFAEEKWYIRFPLTTPGQYVYYSTLSHEEALTIFNKFKEEGYAYFCNDKPAPKAKVKRRA